MDYLVKTDMVQAPVNLPSLQTKIYFGQMVTPDSLYLAPDFWDTPIKIVWKSYQIKESDFRTKTATIVTPQYIDLTQNLFAVLISSPYHENFMGIILSNDFDEDTGLYTYKCQDWSRKHQSKIDMVLVGDTTTYNAIRSLMTDGGCSVPNPTAKQLENWKGALTGLRPEGWYNDKDLGGVTNINPMTQKQQMIIRNVSRIEAIRSLCLGYNIDVYFNDLGVLQIEPYNINDFKKTGLHLEKMEPSDRRYKYELTNVVTGVIIENSDKKKYGSQYTNSTLVSLYGMYVSEISAPEQPASTSSSSSSTSKTTTTSNPYKNKKIWINADNGSCGMKNSIANLLKSKGWTVKNAGCCSNCHYSDYFNVTSDYGVYATLYNGFCAGTVREAYSSSIQNTLKKKGVQLVIMWDTSDWTNPQGMKPYRYGDFTGYNAGRAWDDNFSSSDPSIKNVSQWLKNNNAVYCCGPTADDIVKQFLAGGYFKYAGK